MTADAFPTVEDFQAATLGGLTWPRLLAVDGIEGPNTRRARRQLPRLSPHFTVAELASNGNGQCLVARELVMALEVLRAATGRPLRIVSGYRDPDHNAAVGGAAKSLHLDGLAADLVGRQVTLAQTLRLELFSGIGTYTASGTTWVRHVDLRHLLGRKGTPAAPVRWSYD